MSYNLHTHIRSDRGKWAFAIIAILLILAICGWLIAAAVMNVNAVCLFKHHYDDNGVCTRCGKDKSVKEPAEPEQPEALISEPHRLTASSARLLANSNDVALLSDTVDDTGLETVSTWATGSAVEEGGNSTRDISGIEELPINTSFNEYIYISMYGPSRPTRKVVTLFSTFFKSVSIGSGVPISNTEHTNYHICYLRVDGISGWKEFVFNNNNSTFADKEVTVCTLMLSGDGQYQVCLVKHNAETDVVEARSEIFTVNFNVQELPPEPTKTGYTFTGWYTDEACTNKYTASTVTSDITLYAGFAANTYSIKFNANSGSGNMSNLSMIYDQEKDLPANTFSKDHYAFQGWATSVDGSVVFANEQAVENLTTADGATIELFAVWERSEVKVDFVSEGNTITTWVAIGTKATLAENPSKEGHLFVGWFFEDGTEYTMQNLTEDTTLIAQFSIIRCTVTFVVDGEVYAVYVCDWGTSLAEALNDNNVNPLLMSVEGEYSRNF